MSTHNRTVEGRFGAFKVYKNYGLPENRCVATVDNETDARILANGAGLLMAAMRGHGWGDPLHQQAQPNCIMCRAIRQTVGPLTRERVIELAKMDCDHVSELIFEDRWSDVWIHLGIAVYPILGNNRDNDPDTDRRYRDGEYDGLDAELVRILPTL